MLEFFDPSIDVSILLALLAAAFSAYKFYTSLRKERADKIRSAAAVALKNLDRWQLLVVSLYDELQSGFVEASEQVTVGGDFNVERARDYLWKDISLQRAQVRRSLADEKISTAYVELLPHFPFCRETFQDTLQELDAIEEDICWRLLVSTQREVQWFWDKEESFESAQLGNLLRTTADEFRQELIGKSDNKLAPLRKYLEDVILRSDAELLRQTRRPPASLEKKPKGDQSGKTAILWMGANPADSVRLNIKKEIQEIGRRLDQSHNAFELVEKWAVSADELQSLLMEYRPALVHFSGHGTKDGEIELHTSFNVSGAVPRGAITDLFKILGQDVKCVVLNACYSQSQGEAIASHVGCVVGMSDLVSDYAAIEFSRAFYDAIAHGKDIRTAFSLAQNNLELLDIIDSDVPVLVDPFDRARKLVLRPEE